MARRSLFAAAPAKTSSAAVPCFHKIMADMSADRGADE